ncbi:MAG: response regulator [Elusimicrobia bacterium CG08_land_8_20_14_0_20_51_18]|nr:MAG: response regulator [Elusimicrobia bacterium CG08_land_8_20_14_0_20_51_18]
MEKKKILIIEDSKKTSVILKDVLALEGYEALVVNDGVSGIAAARREKPDLILLDLLLPKVSGFDVCAAIKKDDLTRHIPVLVISTMYTPENVEKVKICGALNFMKKPYKLEELLAEIKKILK